VVDGDRAADADGVVEAMSADCGTKLVAVAVAGISQKHITWDFCLDGSLDHVESELRLGLEDEVFGDLRLQAHRRTVSPFFRDIELEIERQVGSGCRNAKAHTYLTVGDLASRASVLALDGNGMLALLEKAGVVDDPGRDFFIPLEFPDGMPCSKLAHGSIIPGAVGNEVEKLVVHVLHGPGVVGVASSEGLDAFSLALAEKTEEVEGEGLALALVFEVRGAQVSQKLLQSGLAGEVESVRHDRVSQTLLRMDKFSSVVLIRLDAVLEKQRQSFC